MGLVSWFKGLFRDAPIKSTFEEAKDEWKGSHPYSYKRHSWVQRENLCPGSKESPAPDSVRMFNATTGAMKRTRRGKCSVCGKDSHVSKQGTISTHKARV